MTGRPQPDVLAIGEVMALVVPVAAEPLERAQDFRVDAAGAEANVASHLAALGRPAAFAGRLGDDALGRRIAGELAERGVDTRWLVHDPAAPTGLYVKDPGAAVTYYRAGSAASRTAPPFLDALPLDDVRVVHLSGITPALSAECAAFTDAAFDRVAAASATLSFDVNHRPALWAAAGQADAAAERLLALARRADVVFVGLDEAELLWGARSAAEVRALLPEPREVVVKDGATGAASVTRDGVETFVATPAVAVVEVVGAGDAFAAGHLDALLDGHDAAGRLAAGHARAAIALAATSDFPRGEGTAA
ncbi:sugar kinase [Agromyces sp. CFH 90414]|uniref:Sugar kinase n=1 Tax=Agromyces agglutinans TaxID=2662258 RepID=A0A6I2FKD1_9MICO|nr:sugar kinase [Agromyces agglutinans]MRG61118.1 sugar kinase [Agromyces agglutinans]